MTIFFYYFIFVDLSCREHCYYDVKSRRESDGKAARVTISTKRYQNSSLSPPWVRNLDFENSL